MSLERGTKCTVTTVTERTERVHFSLDFLRNALGLAADAQVLVEITRYGAADDDEPYQVAQELTGDLIAVTKTVRTETR